MYSSHRVRLFSFSCVMLYRHDVQWIKNLQTELKKSLTNKTPRKSRKRFRSLKSEAKLSEIRVSARDKFTLYSKALSIHFTGKSFNWNENYNATIYHNPQLSPKCTQLPMFIFEMWIKGWQIIFGNSNSIEAYIN